MVLHFDVREADRAVQSTVLVGEGEQEDEDVYLRRLMTDIVAAAEGRLSIVAEEGGFMKPAEGGSMTVEEDLIVADHTVIAVAEAPFGINMTTAVETTTSHP